jgi:hypothetical protein
MADRAAEARRRAYTGSVGFEQGIDGSQPLAGEPVNRLSSIQEERRVGRSTVVATGTLACPSCDAPVAPFGALSPAEQLACPVCSHGGRVRDFLSLGEPTRPARVQVRLVAGARD